MTDVVAYGEVLWDFHVLDGDGDIFRRFPGGASVNVAAALAHAGFRAAVAGAVGRDAFGDDLVRAIEALGIDAGAVARVPERTGLAFVARDASGEPRFLSYRRGTADGALSPERAVAAPVPAAWLHVGTSSLGAPRPAEATGAVVRAARAHGGHVLLDVNARPHVWDEPDAVRARLAGVAPACALIKASEADLSRLGVDAAWLRAHAPGAVVVVTGGSAGATAHAGGATVTRPAHPASAVDTTGAGDAFCGGMLAAILQARVVPDSAAWSSDAFWTEVLDRGHTFGARAVSCLGAVGWIFR